MTDSPRTEAGRALLASVVPDGGHIFGGTRKSWVEWVAAIEDQAAQAARAEIAEKVRGLPSPDPSFPGGMYTSDMISREAVLRLIEDPSDDR